LRTAIAHRYATVYGRLARPRTARWRSSRGTKDRDRPSSRWRWPSVAQPWCSPILGIRTIRRAPALGRRLRSKTVRLDPLDDWQARFSRGRRPRADVAASLYLNYPSNPCASDPSAKATFERERSSMRPRDTDAAVRPRLRLRRTCSSTVSARRTAFLATPGGEGSRRRDVSRCRRSYGDGRLGGSCFVPRQTGGEIVDRIKPAERPLACRHPSVRSKKAGPPSPGAEPARRNSVAETRAATYERPTRPSTRGHRRDLRGDVSTSGSRLAGRP